jgi:hypothetical protein
MPLITGGKSFIFEWLISSKSHIGIAALTSMAGETGFENPYLWESTGRTNKEKMTFGISGI